MFFIIEYQVDFERVKELTAFVRSHPKPAGVKVHADYETPGGSGVAIAEADRDEDLFKWFVPQRKFYKYVKFSLAMSVQNLVKLTQE